VDYIGFIVVSKGIHVDWDKVKAIRDWSDPKSAKDVSSFLGLAGYYRISVKNFATIALPLYLVQHAKFEWTKDAKMRLTN
jgi:hypothetical protein